MDEDTEELVARAKAGDRDAFNELVRGSYQKVYALALRLTGNEQDAADVVQDTYVRAFRGLRKFREDARFSTWLHRITANTAFTLRERRHMHAHRDLDDFSNLRDASPDADPAQVAESGALRDRLVDALNGLPTRLRSVVVLRDVHGLSHREIADQLDISESAAKVRLHRARAKLREVLTGDAEREDDLVVPPGKSHRAA